MKRRTVIISKINNDYTAFVINMGIEDLSLFKKLEDYGIELKDEGNISDEEMLVLLRHCCTDGFIEGVYSIENHFNRDQKQINIIKTNFENKLKSKGLTIITHTDWSPSFGGDIRGSINKRNYLTIICENIKRKNLEYDKLSEEYENFKQKIETEKKRLEAELENYNKEKRNKIDKEIKETERKIEINTEKIRNQNWYIEQKKFAEKKYNDLIEKFDKLVQRYKNGEKYIEEQKENLPIEILQLIKKKESLEGDISILNTENEELYKKIAKINKEIEELDNQIESRTNYIKNIGKDLENRIDHVMKTLVHDKYLSFNEAKDKFKRTVEMYIQNNMKMPDFEKEYAKNLGLDNETIDFIIKTVFENKI